MEWTLEEFKERLKRAMDNLKDSLQKENTIEQKDTVLTVEQIPENENKTFMNNLNSTERIRNTGWLTIPTFTRRSEWIHNGGTVE